MKAMYVNKHFIVPEDDSLLYPNIYQKWIASLRLQWSKCGKTSKPTTTKRESVKCYHRMKVAKCSHAGFWEFLNNFGSISRARSNAFRAAHLAIRGRRFKRLRSMRTAIMHTKRCASLISTFQSSKMITITLRHATHLCRVLSAAEEFYWMKLIRHNCGARARVCQKVVLLRKYGQIIWV